MCTVTVGGTVSDNKGLSLPGMDISVPALSAKDIADLEFALGLGVDLVALSFVRSPADIDLVHAVMDRVGHRVPVIAKLEKPEAVDDIEAVVDAFDGLMVARGDLGVEMPLERVPLVQKRAIQRCREKAKPVIVATQMLDSMIVNPRPTRAEASDVANAVLDGADAVMLSGETSVGAYPVETVQTMARIIEEAESDRSGLVPALREADHTQPGLLAQAALAIGDGLDATALVTFTLSGNTVRRLARLHPRQPLVALTPVREVRDQLALSWGTRRGARAGRRVGRGHGAGRRRGGPGDGRLRPGRRRRHRRRRAAPHGRRDGPAARPATGRRHRLITAGNGLITRYAPAVADGETAPGDRLRRIEAVTDAGLAQLDVDELLDELLERVRELLAVDTAAVLLLDPSAQYLVATAARGIEEEVRQGVRIPLGRGFAGRIAAEKRARVPRAGRPHQRPQPDPARQGHPLAARGAADGRRHGARRPARRHAEPTAVHRPTTAACSSSWPTASRWPCTPGPPRSSAPPPPRCNAACCRRHCPRSPGSSSRPATSPAGTVRSAATGTTCSPCRPGRCASSSVTSSAAGCPPRSRWAGCGTRCAPTPSTPPTRPSCCDRLDRQVRHFDPDVMATVICAVVDPSGEHMRLSTAGHPPPVISAGADLPAAILDLPADLPIGVDDQPARRHVSTVALPPGTAVCLYTDGLVERRGRSLDAGLDRLADAMFAGPAESVCAAVMQALVGADPPSDDIALLVLRRNPSSTAPATRSTSSCRPRRARSSPSASRCVAGSSTIRADRQATADLLTAVGEACANAIEHAYGPAGGTVSVRLEYQAPDVIAVITDTGRWRAARGSFRGRGITLMRALSDEVTIDRTDTGTRVRIRRTITEGAAR